MKIAELRRAMLPGSPPGLYPEPVSGLTAPPNLQLHFMMPMASWSPSESNLFHAFSFLNLNRSGVFIYIFIHKT